MKSGELNDRDREILRHIGRYRISFNEVVGHLFFDETEPDAALRSLRDRELIETITGAFDKNRRALTITAKGARAIGLKRHLGEPLGPQVMHERVAALSFCCLGGVPRVLLHPDELKRLFEDVAPSGRYHAIERSSNAILLHHIYAPGAATPAKRIIQDVQDDIKKMLAEPNLRRWLDTRMYAHAILVQTDSKANQVRQMLSTPESARQPALSSEYNFCVERVPALGTLEESLHALRTIRKTRPVPQGLFG